MEKLIWAEYDKQMLKMQQPENDIEDYLGYARYPHARFYRELFTFRIGHFGNRILNLNKKVELPSGSFLHLADNWLYPDNWIDTPHEGNTWLERESFKKWIFHIKEPKLDGPITIDDKFIYRPAGLPTKLMQFRSTHGNKFRYINLITEMPTKKEALGIFNHNTLFRIKLFGRLPYFRRFQLILASMLNTIISVAKLFPEKHQFMEIPWGNEIFDKSQFLRTRMKLNPMTVKYPNNTHYLFMMHLVNFMWDSATTSMFKQIPDDILPKVNLILNSNDKYIFFNLHDLKTLNEKNRLFVRFINQLNLLAVLGRIDENNLSPDEKKLVDEHITTSDEVEVDDKESVQIATEYKVKEDKEVLPTGDEEKDKENETIQAKVEDTIKRIANAIPVVSKPTPKVITKAIPVNIPVKNEKEIKQEKVTPALNITASRYLSNKEIDQATSDYIDNHTEECSKFIDNLDELSPKQKERCKILSQKYRTLKLGDETLEEILLKESDVDIVTDSLDEKQIGVIPDKSALHSTVTNFEKAYMKQTNKKHFASIITHFNKLGVFLIGLKEEKEITQMSNLVTYSLQFEDYKGNKTTCKMTIPLVNKEGRVMIDGKKQILKKQRITLPLVKISDTEISLASNYNKTRIERNINKAHNFFSYISSYLNSDKSNATIEFGNGYPNLPISYEYCAIADRYNKVDWEYQGEQGKDRIELYFDFNTRSDHFEGNKETLEKLETVYGTYLGKTNKNHLFINNENEVHAVNKYGGEDVEFGTKSLIEVMQTALKEGERFNRMLTEWISIKILDKQLPVIFMLAYRYGLRNTLDYLGCKYTITERNSKIIVGESGRVNKEVMAGVAVYEAPSLSEMPHTVFRTNIPEPNLRKINHLATYKALGIPADKAVICGSGALVAWGLKDSNADIDVVLDDTLREKFINDGTIVLDENRYWKFEDTEIECGSSEHAIYKLDNILDMGTMEVNEVRILNPYGCFRYYHLLMTSFKDNPSYATKIEKWTRTIAYMKEVVSSWFNHTCWHAGPVQGIKILDPMRDKTPDDRVQALVYASYFPVHAIIHGVNWNDEDAFCSCTIQEDGITPKYTFTIKKNFDIERVSKPFSLYMLEDTTFDNLMLDNVQHPINEIVSDQAVKVLREFKFENWWHVMQELKRQGHIEIIGEDKVIPQETILGASPDRILRTTEGVDSVTTVSGERRYIPKPNDIAIKFADRTLWINRYPLRHSLIVCGLDYFDTSPYDLAEFESKDIYYQLLHDKGFSTNYLKGIDSFYDLFVDPMTHMELVKMGEPTNVRDLLIRCGVLLSTLDHRPVSSRYNHRIRGYEQFNAVVYNEMSRQFAAYQSRRGVANVYSINPDAVFLRIISNAAMVPVEAAGPLEDFKETTYVTHSGIGGRNSESFVVEDRKYIKDDVGIISEASVDNQKVAINAVLSYDPGIVDSLGSLDPKPMEELQPANVFSGTSLMFPFSTNDDSLLSAYIGIYTCIPFNCWEG